MIRTFAFLAAISAATLCAAERFEYSVFRHHWPRKEPGQLQISESGVHYRSDDGKTLIEISLVDVLKGDVSDLKVIRIDTYDRVKRRLSGRQTHTFQLREGVHGYALTLFLSKVLKRPVVGTFELSSKPVAQIRAYHRHRLSGCHGTIEIDPKGIRFLSKQPGDSRTWRYEELETVGTMNRFHFRVSTLAETFNFDLQEQLPGEAYDLVARRVYSLASKSAAPSKE